MIILFIVDEVRVSRNVEARGHQGLSVDMTLSILKDLFDKLVFRLDQIETRQDERDGCEKLQFHDSCENVGVILWKVLLLFCRPPTLRKKDADYDYLKYWITVKDFST